MVLVVVAEGVLVLVVVLVVVGVLVGVAVAVFVGVAIAAQLLLLNTWTEEMVSLMLCPLS